MPILKNFNKDNIVINKRVTKAALKQASRYLPDVLVPAIDDSIGTNYNNLMKSFSYISLIFKQVLTIAESYHEKLQREADEEMLGMSGIYSDSDNEDDNEDSGDDSVSLDSAFYRGNTPQGRASRRNDSSSDSSLTNRSRHQPITIKILDKKIMDNLNVNSLEKETINVNFYVHTLEGQFGSLDKLKKRKLMIICQTILHQMREIVEYYPNVTHIYDQLINIFDSLKESIKIIESELKQAGELGFTGAGLISGSTTSMTGSGVSHFVMQSHAPSRYVNQNFYESLRKRND
jgi:uncharacterized protein YsxB (DUF464 family)